MGKNNLQLFSFEVNKSNIIEAKIYVMKLPKELKNIIESIKGLKARDFGYSFALKGLGKIARNYSRDIVAVNSSHSDLLNKDKFWIYSTSRFDLQGLKLHICEWLNSELKRIGKLDEEFHLSEELAWDEEITSMELFNNDPKIYEALPNLYVNDMCKEPIFLSSINATFNFYPLIREDGAGLISEPIYKQGCEPYSYYIKLSLKKPFDMKDKLYINIDLSTKVWREVALVTDKDNFISSKEGTSVYIFKKDAFINKQRISFIQCTIKRDKDRVKFKNSYDTIYGNHIGLAINELVREPKKYMNFKENLICLVTNSLKKTKTKRGVSQLERIDIFNIFSKMYLDLKTRTPIREVKYIKINKIKETKKFNNDHIEGISKLNIKKWNKSPLKISYRNSIENLIINVYSSNENLFLDTIIISKKILGIDEVEQQFITHQGIKIEFKQCNENISRELSDEKSKTSRVYEIENEVAVSSLNSTKTLALVDIPEYHNTSRKHLDSKASIRVALKNKGVTSQFINGYEKENSEIKLQNALYDLYYAAGFLNSEFYKQDFDKKVILGVDFVARCDKSLLVISKLQYGQLSYKLYGDEQWTDAQDLIKTLEKGKIISSDRLLREQKYQGVENWIWDTVQSVLDTSEEEVYLYADATLRNNYWKFLANSNFNIENIEVSDDRKRLSIIRINNTDEVPDFYIGEGEPNLKKGLFSNDLETFYMIGGRSDTLQIGKSWTKYNSPTTLLGKQRATEMVILSEEVDTRLKVAQESFLLRKLVPTYDKETLLPLPLYVINRISEYANAILEVGI